MDLTIYLGILNVLAMLVSGPFGTLSDAKGRKRVMGISAIFNTLGDIWLYMCASVERLRFPVLIYFAAVVKGFGGSSSVIKVAGLAYIAETSTPDTRSFYLGLVGITSVAANALASLVSGSLITDRHFAASFAVGICAWTVYLLYLVLVVGEPERHWIPDGVPNDVSSDDSVAPQQSNTSRWTPSVIRGGSERLVTALIQPLGFIATDPTLVLLGLMEFWMRLGLGTFNVLIIWLDHMFGLSPREAGNVWAIIWVSRAFSLLCVFPALKTVHHRIAAKQSVELHIEPSEPLNIGPQRLVNEAAEVVEAAEPSEAPELTLPVDDTSTAETLLARKFQKTPAAQELFICRVCFLLDALGMILVSLSTSSTQVSIAGMIGSLGSPGYPSLQALTTMASPPAKLGRVLAAMSIIESAAFALLNPLVFGLYNVTLELWPGAVWWFSAVLFLLCGFVVGLLRPARLLPTSVI